MSNAPVTHIEESLKLTADDTVDLFELQMKTGPTVFFWNGPPRNWNGQNYEQVACQLTGEAANSDSQYARPILTVANPDNTFGVFAAEGYLDLAVLTRRRVLQQDFINGVVIFQPRIWLIGRPSRVTWQLLQLECRDTTDIPAYKIPRRTFNPPTYPFVLLQ